VEPLFRARPVAHVVRLRLRPEPVSTIFFPFESSYCLWADHATRGDHRRITALIRVREVGDNVIDHGVGHWNV